MSARRATPRGDRPTDRPATPGEPQRIRVLLPLPLGSAYDYLVPDGVAVEPGNFVVAPLGPRRVVGVVWDGVPGEVADAKLKSIEDVLDAAPLTPELRRFIEWVATYTMTPPGAVLRMAMSVSAALETPRPTIALAITEEGRHALLPLPPEERRRREREVLTPARRRVLEEAAAGSPRRAVELAEAAACGAGVVKGLVERGLLVPVEIAAEPQRERPDPNYPGPMLSPEQKAAANALVAKVRQGKFAVTLLDGVTGSGKTEVYFEAVGATLREGKQALVLLPEIALGAQFLERFAQRFGCRPAAWHSDLPPKERRAVWRAVGDGSARVVVGARSALFLPFRELGLIVVDEEHDASFKQEDGVVYHARDMAVVRAHLAGFPIILSSATPSLETVVNVEQGRYSRLELPARHGGAVLPEIRVIDLRRTPPERQRFIAPPLASAVDATLAAGEQAMLFLNRRGYAPLTLCRSCGERLQCPNCTAWLVEHRFHRHLQCHHCGHTAPLPEFCAACGAAHSFAACGPGVERIAEEVAARWPASRAAIMASDTLEGPRALAETIRAVEEGRIDILVGTQVMAKGHHFPKLTLVGVVDADLGLAGGDLRAAERTYQLLHQVAGRAGRAERPGTVYLQTWMPENAVVAALVSGDRDRFLQEEAEARRRHGMPPFGRLAALILASPDAEAVDFAAAAFARAAPMVPGVEVLGPAPAPLAVLRSRHRRRFLVKASRSVHLQAAMRDWLGRVKVPNAVRVQVDIDPYSFL
jgi:primosomal protein N' (replication factor Y)